MSHAARLLLVVMAMVPALAAQTLYSDMQRLSLRPGETGCVLIHTSPPTPGVSVLPSYNGAVMAVTPSVATATDANGDVVFRVQSLKKNLFGSALNLVDLGGTFATHTVSVIGDVGKLTLTGTAGSEPGLMQLVLEADPPVQAGDVAIIFTGPFPGQIPLSIFNFNEPRSIEVSAANLFIPPGYAGSFFAPYDRYVTPGFNVPDLGFKGRALYVHAATLRLGDPGGPFQRLSQPEPIYLAPDDSFCDRGATMIMERAFFPVIENGKQQPLVIGGGTGAVFAQVATDQCEVYDPQTDSWSINATAMTAPRSLHTATKLQDGRYLIVGGVDSNNDPQNSAEIYDPKSNTFTAVGNLATPRVGHSATLLPNGKVLIAGGLAVIGPAGLLGIIQTIVSAQATTAIFTPDPNGCGGTFSPGPTMSRGRAGHAAIELADGRILMAGGVGPGILSLPSIWSQTEFYTGAGFSNGPSMATPRALFPVVQIEEGPDRYLVAGGLNDIAGNGAPTAAAEVYDAVFNGQGSWSSAGTMAATRGMQAAYVVGNRVLQIGGITGDLVTPSSEGTSEWYDISSNTWSPGPNLSFPRGGYGHYRNPYGLIHLIGGATGAGPSPQVHFSTDWYFQ